MYPHKSITKAKIKDLPEDKKLELQKRNEIETTRIKNIYTQFQLETELDEASQKWTYASEFLSGKNQIYANSEDAVFDMGLANNRYWSALSKLEKLHDRNRLLTRIQFWIIVVGGFIIAIIGTLFTVLSYFK